MRLFYTNRFVKSYEQAPVAIQGAFDRRVPLLLGNLRHPSLRAKKYDEASSGDARLAFLLHDRGRYLLPLRYYLSSEVEAGCREGLASVLF